MTMYQKACGATVGSCTEPENDRDGIIIKDEEKKPANNVDFSEFDIIKAVQFGAFDRVRELVEANYDVNKPDNDFITLLHWASINNRKGIISYLLEKGAIVDARGGDLNATPLHWAVRQGHLASIVLLMNAGADPLIRDAEGCSCIHLASQFGHTACVAYLIARQVNPDTFDTGGMTALMWASWKIPTLDPVRLLLTLEANVNLQDITHGNTALHWAIMARNPKAIYTLVFKGKTNMEIRNQRGETPLQMLQQHIGSQWIHPEVVQRVKDLTQQKTSGNIILRLTMSDRARWWSMWIIPYVFLFTIALIMATELFLFVKIIIIVIFCAIISVIKRIMLDDEHTTQLPLVFYWASKTFFYISWLIYIFQIVSPLTTIVFIIINLILWYCFVKLWRGDPGIIKLTHNQRLKTIIELAEKGGNAFEPTKFCSACLVQRPIRSKHCSVCDHCVGKFDHHCPWIGNDVGIKNHKMFMAFLALILMVMITILYGGIIFYQDSCNVTVSDGLWNALLIINNCSPWIAWMMLNALFHLLWVTILTSIQIYQIVFIGMTTNERINRGRYKHFIDLNGKSPFNRGVCSNIIDFFQCSLFGLLHPLRRNWMLFGDQETVRRPKNGSLLTSTDDLQYV